MMSSFPSCPLHRTLSSQSKMSYHDYFPRYVSVSERQEKSLTQLAGLRKKNPSVSPVVIEGTAIARSFWGKAWCKHLEIFADYDNRIPRGKSYVRSGAVLDLQIGKGCINALVSGSSSKPYKVSMQIACLSLARQEAIEALFRESGSVELLDLLQGKIPPSLMGALIDPHDGLFPQVKELIHHCSCPDIADFCKHQAAVLYGVGNRLDAQPELLFLLRGLDCEALVGQAGQQLTSAAVSELGETDLSALFGLELVDDALWSSPEQDNKPQNKKEAKKTARASAKSTEKNVPKHMEPTRQKKTASERRSTRASAPGKNAPPASLPAREQLQYIRKYTRWDGKTLAARLATTLTNIHKWLDGDKVPTLRFAAKIEALYQEVRSAVRRARGK